MIVSKIPDRHIYEIMDNNYNVLMEVDLDDEYTKELFIQYAKGTRLQKIYSKEDMIKEFYELIHEPCDYVTDKNGTPIKKGDSVKFKYKNHQKIDHISTIEVERISNIYETPATIIVTESGERLRQDDVEKI